MRAALTMMMLLGAALVGPTGLDEATACHPAFAYSVEAAGVTASAWYDHGCPHALAPSACVVVEYANGARVNSCDLLP